KCGGLDRETEQVAVLREGITRALGNEGDGRAGRGLRIAVIESVDELFCTNRSRLRHEALSQAGSSQFEGDVADVEREGRESIFAGEDFGLRNGRWSGGFGKSFVHVLEFRLARFL